MCISFHAINVTTFSTHSPILHPLPFSTPSSLFCIHFHFQYPLPYSASTSTFSTHFPIQHPLPLSAPTSLFTFTSTFNTLFLILHPLSPSAPTPPFNSHKFHVLQPPVTASFRFFPRTFILATRHFPIKKLLIHFAHLVPLPLHHSSSLS